MLLSKSAQRIRSSLLYTSEKQLSQTSKQRLRLPRRILLNNKLHNSNDIIWLAGDVNFPNIDWHTYYVFTSKIPFVDIQAMALTLSPLMHRE